MKKISLFFTGQKNNGCDMLNGPRPEVFALNRPKPGQRSFILLLQVLWALWLWLANCEMHHPLLGMPADNLKSTDDLVY